MNQNNTQKEKIIIVGGGFAGIRCALDLNRLNKGKFHIVLINSTPHFEYHAALYRVVTGRNPLEVCIPLSEIFAGTSVEVVVDTITKCDLTQQQLKSTSGSTYRYDKLVLALGSETDYYNTPGLEKETYTLKTTTDALRLKRHLHEILTACGFNERKEQVCQAQFMIIGGGPTGVEIAGELAVYMRTLAKKHNIDPSMITIDLIQSPNRLLPHLPETVSTLVEKRLRSLGVNLYFNRRILKSTPDQALIEGADMKTSTIIWAGGVKAHRLYQQTLGLETTPSGRVIVTPHLRAKGHTNVFIAGDGADTPFTGSAQTAFYDGSFVAKTIIAEFQQQSASPYTPPQPSSAVPIGPGWAAVVIGDFTVTGWLGWMIRRLIDFKVFWSVLPLGKALTVFQAGKSIVESCPICEELETTT